MMKAQESLSSIGNEAAVQKFITLDFTFISSFVETLEQLQQSRLSELLFPFYQTFGKLKPFLNWVVETEVKQTPRLNALFRSDSFYVQFMNNLLFSDLGLKYLTFLLQPILDFAVATPLQLEKEPKSEEEIISRNKLLDLLEDFLQRFEDSLLRCPLFLRDMFQSISQAVEQKKFEDGKSETPFVLSFIFFRYICPTLVNPVKYDLIPEEAFSSASECLLSCSKVLNDLSLNNTDKWDPTVNQWIGKSFERLLTLLQRIIDQNEITKAQILIDASVEPRKYSETEQIEQRKGLLSFFEEVNPSVIQRSESHSSLGSTAQSSEEPSQVGDKAVKYLAKMNNPKWKLKKEGKDYKVWRIKEDGIVVFGFKVETVINRPLKEVAFNYHRVQYDLKYNSYISKADWYIVGNPPLLEYGQPSQFIGLVAANIPAPFQPRDTITLNTFHIVDEDTIIRTYENSEAIPPVKGFIRSHMYLSGAYFKALSPSTTQVINITHGDSKGSIPVWLLNMIAIKMYKTHLLIKEIFEKGYDPSKHPPLQFKQL